jgi:nucleoside 2-deoxyribosyltransferase
MKLYLAARYARREEMEKIAEQLKAAGFEITSDWVYGAEEGMSNGDIALKDLSDLEAADAILAFTEPKGFMFSGGGRHVEFGVAAGLGKYLYFIGDKETVFHHTPWAQQFQSVEDFIAKKGGQNG